jgi:hypothetical protein
VFALSPHSETRPRPPALYPRDSVIFVLIRYRSTRVSNNLIVSTSESPAPTVLDDAGRERAETVLRQAFISAQLGMPSEDPETAVESLWIILEALLVDHLAPDERLQESRGDRRTAIGNHWRRMVSTAVTHTFVLGGDFVQPDRLSGAVERNALKLADGSLWHTRRPPAQGALALGVHMALLRLDTTARSGNFPQVEDFSALEELIALSTLGAVLAAESGERDSSNRTDQTDGSTGSLGRWARTSDHVAASFGIPDVELHDVAKSGWACGECGCVFLGRVEAGVAYPDRFAPVGRAGPCDMHFECSCHAAPLQRRIR